MYAARPIVWHKIGIFSLFVVFCVVVFTTTNIQTSEAQNDGDLLAKWTEDDAAAFVDGGFNPVLTGLSVGSVDSEIQPDGKIVVGGSFSVINGVSKNGIVRFNADGTLDTTFNTGAGVNDLVNGIGLQSDGKIIVVGSFTSYNNVPVGRIIRLNSDGSLDLTFNAIGVGMNTGAGANNIVSEVKVLPNNKILIGGVFTSYSGATQNRFARLNANGSLDTTFVVGVGASSTVSAIDVQTDGKILIAGAFTTYNTVPAQRVARINTDGSIDTSFATANGASGSAGSIVALSDGKVLVGGFFTTYATIAKNGIVKLDSSGAIDPTFDVSGTGASISTIAVKTNGKLLVGGAFSVIAGGTRAGLAGLNADGTLDTGFDSGTGTATAGLQDIALQTDGRMIIVGNFTAYNGAARGGIARVNADGSIDPSMPTSASNTGSLSAIVPQVDGKIMIGGSFVSVNGTPRVNIARLNADGTLDTSFDPGTGPSSQVTAIAVQADGKVLIGGSFATVNGASSPRIARLNANGSLDTTFAVGTGGSSDISVIRIQPSDGKVLIGGLFTTYNSASANRIARLNTDGTLDTTFLSGTAFNSVVRTIEIQTDNKILVGGAFVAYNSLAAIRIARINADGTLDATFNSGTGVNGDVRSIAVLAGGKILIAGFFNAYNAITRRGIARINTDGSVDTGFDPGVGVADQINTIISLPNGKSLIAGNFTTFNNLPRNRIARLNANGSYDPTFVSGLGPNQNLNTMAAQADGKIIVGGAFKLYNVSSRTGIARFSNVSDTTVDFDGDGKSDYAIIRRGGLIGPWTWWINESATGRISTFNFGQSPRDMPQPGDFDGDGKDDIAVWRNTPQAGESSAYYIIQSSTNTIRIIQFGQNGDVPLTEDYDGDGKDDLSVWRANSAGQGAGQAYWFYLGSLNNPNNNITYVPWGMRYGGQQDQVDEAYPGDFDGDGRADFRIQRRADITVPSASTPAVFYTLTASGNITTDYFGYAGDRIVPGDYDGDGKTDICVARGFNLIPGSTTWYIRYTSGIADSSVVFGSGFDFAQGDYDGDGATDIGYFMTGATDGETGFWYMSSANAQAVRFVRWGARPPGTPGSGDFPVAAYNNR